MILYKVEFNDASIKKNIKNFSLYLDKIDNIELIKEHGFTFTSFDFNIAIVDINYDFRKNNKALKEIIEYIKQYDRDKKINKLI